jgi:death-on-curing protein
MVKDPGLLDSALARPKTTLFGEFAYPTIEVMAAAMHQSLVKNHPLIDGNKRTAWLLLVSFLRINDLVLVMTLEEGLDFTLGVAEGRYELEQAAAIIKTHLVSL